MKKIIKLVAIYLLYANIGCSQNTNVANEISYEESNYKIEDSLLVDRSGYFCKVYVNKNDSSLKMWKLHADPQRLRLQGIYFTKDNIRNGPFKIYSPDGYLYGLGHFVNNKWDGKWLDYNEKGIVVKEYYYTQGKRSGTWKYFDDNGKFLREEKY